MCLTLSNPSKTRRCFQTCAFYLKSRFRQPKQYPIKLFFFVLLRYAFFWLQPRKSVRRGRPKLGCLKGDVYWVLNVISVQRRTPSPCKLFSAKIHGRTLPGKIVCRRIKDRSSAQQAKIISLDDLVVSPPPKRRRTRRHLSYPVRHEEEAGDNGPMTAIGKRVVKQAQQSLFKGGCCRKDHSAG